MSNNNVPALKVEGLHKSFGGLTVLNGIDFEVHPGGRLGIIGPNGSGKTTMMEIISGFLAPNSGTVRVAGKDISRSSASQRAQQGISRTFQVAAVVQEWTVFDNLALAASTQKHLGVRRLQPVRRNHEITAAVEQAAEDWGVSTMLNTPVAQLSYGFVRRTELAVASLSQPRVFLLDEPAAGLSNEEGAEVVQRVSNLFPTAAIILVEHDMDIMFEFSDEILVLGSGEVLAHGSPEEVRNHERVREAYLGSEL